MAALRGGCGWRTAKCARESCADGWRCAKVFGEWRSSCDGCCCAYYCCCGGEFFGCGRGEDLVRGVRGGFGRGQRGAFARWVGAFGYVGCDVGTALREVSRGAL